MPLDGSADDTDMIEAHSDDMEAESRKEALPQRSFEELLGEYFQPIQVKLDTYEKCTEQFTVPALKGIESKIEEQ